MTTVVKRRGHEQPFDERKVYASVYAACLTVRISTEQAEMIASEVVKQIKLWLEDKETVDAYRIFVRVISELERLDPDAALMYKTHRDIN